MERKDRRQEPRAAIVLVAVALALCAVAASPDAGSPKGDRAGSDGPVRKVVLPAPTCTDGRWNGFESDVDCGAQCPKCRAGCHCRGGEDCESGTCERKVCVDACIADPNEPLALGCPSRNLCRYSMAFAQVLAISLNELAMQARIVPAFKDGVPTGYKFFAVRERSLYEKLGMRSNDILQSVNGVDLTSPEVFESALKDAIGRGVAVGVLDRCGERIVIQVELR